ncbi:MAG: hypothetical protein ACR2P3_12420 [Geminicoccaceae bacterium]
MLRILIERAHVDESAFQGKAIFSAVLEDWQLDLLSSYGEPAADLANSDDDEDEALLEPAHLPYISG